VRRRRAVGEEQASDTHDEGPVPEAAPDHLEQIKELAELREQGILTEEEFSAEKKKLLGL
jgi:Short C-terminal domain